MTSLAYPDRFGYKRSMAEDGVIQSPEFVTTRWSVVLRAKDQASPEALAALEELCRVYWFPLYAYARGRGRGVEDAQDLTQEFFARLLEKNYLGIVERRRGKFRWFLLAAFKHFLANEYDRRLAQKRGGAAVLIPLDTGFAESQLEVEGSVRASPDRMYDQRWAIMLLERAHTRLREEYGAQGKAARFEALENYLPGEQADKTYAETAVALGMTEGAVKVEAHRLRKRFGELLRHEIANTVADESEIEEEARYLISVLPG